MAIHAQPQLYQENLGYPLCNNSQGWWRTMENGSGFITIQQKQESQSFHQQQQQKPSLLLHHQQQQMNQNVGMQYGQSFLVPTPRNNNHVNYKDQYSVVYSQTLASQMEAQRQQLDQYLRLQDESLRLLMHEQRKKQLGLLMKKLESNATTLLRQKDAEIAHAANRQTELEGFLRKLEMEGQEWQRMAQENEAMVEYLNKTLEELREKAGCCISNNAVEDAESCCDVNMIGDRDEQETGESSSRRLVLVDDNANDGQHQQNGTRKMMVCKGCNSRESCMLFLPCRHLCSCNTCEAFLGYCPVCKTTKKASIEALL